MIKYRNIPVVIVNSAEPQISGTSMFGMVYILSALGRDSLYTSNREDSERNKSGQPPLLSFLPHSTNHRTCNFSNVSLIRDFQKPIIDTGKAF